MSPEADPNRTQAAGTSPPGQGKSPAGSSAADPGTRSPKPDAGNSGNGQAPRDLQDMTIGELAFEVTDRATVLFREEIELAKTEISEKFNRLVRGSVVGVAAGIFAILALILLMHALAWGLNSAFFGSSFWAGFLIEAFIFILTAIGAGLFARRSFQNSAPPVPEMAIEQAKEIKSDFEESRSERKAAS